MAGHFVHGQYSGVDLVQIISTTFGHVHSEARFQNTQIHELDKLEFSETHTLHKTTTRTRLC